MADKASFITASEVTLLNAAATVAFPTAAADGVDITSGATKWKDFGNAHVEAAVHMETSGAQVTSAGLGLYGYRASTTKWYLLGKLNDGNAITTLGANTGFAQIIQMAGCYDRLAIGPLAAANVTPSAGTFTFKAVQIRFVEES